MHKLIFLSLASFFIYSCTTSRISGNDHESLGVKQELLDDYTFKITQYSEDPAYGYNEKNPIRVGGYPLGPKNERRFLNALSGPGGEKIEYHRIGSCCPFKTKNSEWGGMLDMYEVSYEGLDKSLTLYLNMYDSDTLKVPVGFKLKN